MKRFSIFDTAAEHQKRSFVQLQINKNSSFNLFHFTTFRAAHQPHVREISKSLKKFAILDPGAMRLGRNSRQLVVGQNFVSDVQQQQRQTHKSLAECVAWSAKATDYTVY